MNSARRNGLILALSCALTGVALAAAPAQAQPAAAQSGGTLVLSVVPDRQSAAPVRTALLRCDGDGDGGTHAAARAACDDLRTVAGDFDNFAAGDGFCTDEYAPVTAIAAGVWHGRPVSFRANFPNRCLLLQNTGNVFNF